MTIDEFNQQAIRTEDSNNVYFDLRPFAERQSEAMDTYLNASLMSIQTGVSSFGTRQIVLITDASMVLSDTARAYIAELRAKGVSMMVEARRPFL
ncbi:MAG TPA: hypothetical protein VJX30_11855 [Terriglobales bacterium]|nr:hypothetical protein [Terriglobales bacterium]